MYTVYKRTCITTGLVYVGVTSKTIEQRWLDCIVAAEKLRPRVQRKDSPMTIRKKKKIELASTLWTALLKYGSDCWTHDILETHESLVDALLAEQRWISTLESNSPKRGYNHTRGGELPHFIKIDEVIQLVQDHINRSRS